MSGGIGPGMAGTIRPVTAKEVKRAARNHADAMIRLHNAIHQVAATAARLTEALDRGDGAPFAGGTLYERADAAMGQLGEAYERIASLFDDLPAG